MNISQEGIDLIKSFEGLKLEAYKCQAGIWTIGYGHTKNVKDKDIISNSQADCFLVQDLYFIEQSINQLVKVELNQNQYDALCSFVFNVGVLAFNQSTLLAKLNMGNYIGASNEFERWNKNIFDDIKQFSSDFTNRRKVKKSLLNK